MSYVIARRNDKVLQFYCDDYDWKMQWSAFCRGMSSDLNWKNSTAPLVISFPCMFPKEREAQWYLDKYKEIKTSRDQAKDLDGWEFKIIEYLR